jgi:hypothetical protein
VVGIVSSDGCNRLKVEVVILFSVQLKHHFIRQLLGFHPFVSMSRKVKQTEMRSFDLMQKFLWHFAKFIERNVSACSWSDLIVNQMSDMHG